MRAFIILVTSFLVLGCSSTSSVSQGATDWLGHWSPVSSYKLERKHTLTLPQRGVLYIPLALSNHGMIEQQINNDLNGRFYSVFSSRLNRVMQGLKQESPEAALLSADQMGADFVLYAKAEQGNKAMASVGVEERHGSDESQSLKTSKDYRVAVVIFDVVQQREIDHLVVSAVKGFMNFDDANESFTDIANLVAKHLVAY